MNFWQPTAHVKQNIFENTLVEACSPNLYASFGTFCVEIGQLCETQWVFEACLKINKSLSWKENSSDHLKTHCAANNGPIWTQKVPKRSVKMSTTSFYKSFFKKYVGIHEQSAVSKIRSVHTYVMHRTVYFGWICSCVFIW